jgi:IclR family transcriptional regulator, acetate operon repressor
MKLTRPYPGTQAALRAIRLLKAFTRLSPERGLTELAGTVGLNKTTAYRLLTALESEGMVQRAGDGEAYRLGPELVALATRVVGSGELRVAARPELSALAQATRETATLEVLVGDSVLILDEAIGGHMLGAVPSTGTRWPAHATSTGKVLLAALPESERDTVLRGELRAVTPRTITDPRALLRELVRVRQRGYAVATEELEPGFVAVGAPVRSADGRVVAALGIGGPRTRLSPGRVAELARHLPPAAARVSARLGHRAVETPRASAR